MFSTILITAVVTLLVCAVAWAISRPTLRENIQRGHVFEIEHIEEPEEDGGEWAVQGTAPPGTFAFLYNKDTGVGTFTWVDEDGDWELTHYANRKDRLVLWYQFTLD